MIDAREYLQYPSAEYSDSEVLSLLFGGASDKAQMRAQHLLDSFGGLEAIANADAQSISRHAGIGPKLAARLHASFETGRRLFRPRRPSPLLHTPESVYKQLHGHLVAAEEELWALYLDRQKRLLMQKRITIGSYAYTIVDPRQVFHHAVLCRASSLVIAHNHPSGDPQPSAQDLQITERIALAGRLLCIPLLDHLIMGSGRYCSLAKLGALPEWRDALAVSS
jgi:DNA repair protein RadC